MYKVCLIVILTIGTGGISSGCDSGEGTDNSSSDLDSNSGSDSETDTGSNIDSDSNTDSGSKTDVGFNTDSDSDSNSESSTEFETDFPGTCKCAARFMFQGDKVDICSNDDFCGCHFVSNESFARCHWIEGNNEVSFYGFKADKLSAGATYSAGQSFFSSVVFTISGIEYDGGMFEVDFTQWGAVGELASGSFSASVSANKSEFFDVTDGLFYGPIAEE